jgi:nitrate/TMAO reductase-like tetraheme cytochrome c subunit
MEVSMRNRGRRNLLLATPIPALLLAGVLALGGGSVAAIKATEAPAFCAKCHEMQPFHDAWAKGPHKNISCVACHVDPGTTAEVTHKVSALKEVYDHFASSPRFPGKDVSVPNARCLVCHTDLPQKTKSGFPHAAHLSRTPCVSCHPDAGHNVTVDALAKAGLLAASNTTAPPSAETTGGQHIAVDCSRCHDLVKTACSSCHTPKHAPRGTCSTCHAAGPAWTFTHPGSAATCVTCHEPPKSHYTAACTTCHDLQTPFAKTVYKHADPQCTTCHALPDGHIATPLVCSTCHAKPGVDWSFTHPASTACTTCHAAPATHFGSDCAGCHKPGVPFKQTTYTHTSNACATCHQPPANHHHSPCTTCHTPGVKFVDTKWTHTSSTSCGSCHTRPSKHSTSACSGCHKQPGRSWAFTHPNSTACSTCHTPPANHFGAACSSCHKPSVPFKSTQLNHPSTHHDWHSMACSNCHPSGPPKVGCTCHGGGPNGPN